MEELRGEAGGTVVISGCIGPAGRRLQPHRDAHRGGGARTTTRPRSATFADTAADMVTAITMTYADEAIGLARAAREAGLPVAISFTLETDGRLPSGQALGEAIAEVDGRPTRRPRTT